MAQLRRAAERPVHAYLLVGARGSGVEDAARCFAAALVAPEDDARAVDLALRGMHPDVVEFEPEGANYRVKEDVRERIIPEASRSPIEGARKVIVLFEAERLVFARRTESANALLKTIEEPPEHAVFILASTELHKIPATIISRCQKFSFRRLTDKEVEERLREVAEREGFTVTAGAAAQIARAADGSLRDALSLLEQAATLSGGKVDEQRCAEIFAFVDRAMLEGLYASAVSGDRAELLATVERAREEGVDPRHAAREFTSMLREILIASTDKSDRKSAGRAAQLADLAPYDTLLRAVAVQLETERQLARASDPWIVWEMSLLKLAELPRLRSLEEALAGRAGATPALSSPAAAPPAAGPRFVSLVPAAPPDVPEGPPPAANPAVELVRRLQARRVTIGTYASLATRIEVRGDDLVLEFPIDKAAAKDALQKPEVLRLIAEVAKETYGRELSVRLTTGPPIDGDLAAAAREVPPKVLSRERASNRAQDDPMVQKAMALFRGEVVDIKEEK